MTKSSIFSIKDQRGQTIVELMLAILIITLGILGFATLSTSNIEGVDFTIDKIMASNLAREGVEVVRNLRDSNWLYGYKLNAQGEGINKEWDFQLGNNPLLRNLIITFDPRTDYIENYENEIITPIQYEFDNCINNNTCRVYWNKVDNYYTQAASADTDPTKFFRIVLISQICEDPTECNFGFCDPGIGMCSKTIGLKVTSKVKWQSRDQEHDVAITEFLYDWK